MPHDAPCDSSRCIDSCRLADLVAKHERAVYGSNGDNKGLQTEIELLKRDTQTMAETIRQQASSAGWSIATFVACIFFGAVVLLKIFVSG